MLRRASVKGLDGSHPLSDSGHVLMRYWSSSEHKFHPVHTKRLVYDTHFHLDFYTSKIVRSSSQIIPRGAPCDA